MKKDLSFEIEELQGQVKSKDQQLGEFTDRLVELEKIQVYPTKEISI